VSKIEDDIKAIEEEIKKTAYNKKSEHHVGRLKAKLAYLKSEAEKRRASHKGAGIKYAVKKSGNATVCLLGFPSVGKSTILNKLTNANSEVGAYDFTTVSIVPGNLAYKGANIQILDMPGIIEGASVGKGRGKAVISVARVSDLIILVLDPVKYKVSALIKELEFANIIPNGTKPNVIITHKEKGGLKIVSTVKLTKIDTKMVEEVLHEWQLFNGEVVIREDVTIDQIIDVVSGAKVYIPAIAVVNKKDLLSNELKDTLEKELKNIDHIYISAENGIGIEDLKELIYNKLNLIAIYLKPPGKEPDLKEPLIMKSGSTIKTLCETLHKDILENFKYAQVWGKAVKFPGQIVGLDYVLNNNDIVTIQVKHRTD